MRLYSDIQQAKKLVATLIAAKDIHVKMGIEQSILSMHLSISDRQAINAMIIKQTNIFTY